MNRMYLCINKISKIKEVLFFVIILSLSFYSYADENNCTTCPKNNDEKSATLEKDLVGGKNNDEKSATLEKDLVGDKNNDEKYAKLEKDLASLQKDLDNIERKYMNQEIEFNIRNENNSKIFFDPSLTIVSADDYYKFSIGGRAYLQGINFNHPISNSEIFIRRADFMLSGAIGKSLSYNFYLGFFPKVWQEGSIDYNFLAEEISLAYQANDEHSFKFGLMFSEFTDQDNFEAFNNRMFIEFPAAVEALSQGTRYAVMYNYLSRHLNLKLALMYGANHMESLPKVQFNNFLFNHNLTFDHESAASFLLKGTFFHKMTDTLAFHLKGSLFVEKFFQDSTSDTGNSNSLPVYFISFLSPEALLSFPSMYVMKFDNNLMGSIEAILIYNSFSFQGEFLMNSLENSSYNNSTSDPNYYSDYAEGTNFYGYYLQMSYMLTGETHLYDKKNNIISYVAPISGLSNSSFSVRNAWEIAFRYSHLNLSNDNMVDDAFGNKFSSMTLGLNWYVNRSVRLMFNYAYQKIIFNNETVHPVVLQIQLQYNI